MMLRLSSCLWLALVWCSASVQAASQCTAAFAYPVQSHASPGRLAMSGESRITSATMDTSYPFLGKTIQPNANCNNGGYWNDGTWISNCNVSGALASSLKALAFISDPDDFPANPGDFPTFSSQRDLTCNGAISPAARQYRDANWSSQNCQATLRSGQTYYFETLSLSGGAVLNLNGATVYAEQVQVTGYADGIKGSGNLHVNELTVSGNGKLSEASVTVYDNLALSTSSIGNVTARFQSHYAKAVSLSGQSQMPMAAGDWAIRELTVEDNSVMTLEGQSTLGVYDLKMKGQGKITAAGSRSDLTLKLHQTLQVSDNGVINGYLQANYIKTLKHQSSSDIQLYFRGGSHWIDKLELGSNDKLIFDTGFATQFYLKSDLTLSEQIEVNAGGKASDLMLYHFGKVTMSDNAKLNAMLYVNAGDLVMSGQAQLMGAVSAVNVTMTNNSKVIHEPFTGDWPGICEEELTCFSDDFSASTLSNNWVVARSSGNFTPSIVGQRLRLTQAVGDQSTSTTYQRLFPAASNLVTIEFNHYAYNGSGADGIAVVLSDAKVTPQPGAFGGPLGYGFKPGISGFAGGWLGVGIDEFGNFSGEGGVANVGQRRQSVAVRGSGVGTSGYNYLRGTCSNGTTNINGNCLNPIVDNNGSANHSYRLTVDSRIVGQSMVKVERNTGSGYVTLIDSFNAMAQAGQAAVPEDFLLSLTGSTGGSTNIHEIDNVRICALRSSPVGVQIDHFQLEHSGQALTCNPETVTIKACADAACSSLITDPVTATLSLTPTSGSNGWVGGNTVTFSGGSTTVQLRNNTASAVTIGVSGSTPTTKPFSTTLCKSGNGTPSVAACTLSFADSGFIFDVPDTYSNQPQDVTISAVKKDDITKQCVPGFTGVRSVGFWGAYINPNTNNFGSKISIDGNAIATYAASVPSPTPTTLNLTFDNQGKATLKKVTYLDAGRMQLSASYNGSGETAGLVMLGADQFVARPVGLCITPPQGVCAAGDSSCPVFKKAGETFQVDIKAMAWESANDGDICAGNQTTPNFVLSGIGLGSTLVAPSPGTNATVGTTTYNHVAATNSLNSVNQTVSEVGVFRMTATPPVVTPQMQGYFGYTIPSAQSQPVGRFIPADFELVSGDIVPACSVFSYMGQPFGVTLDIIARNVAGGKTSNYTGDFAKGNAYITTANSKNGTSLSSRLRSLQPLPWLDGQAAFSGSSEFVRLSDTQPDGPFKALLFGLYMQDNDGERTLIASPDFNEVVTGDCSGSNCNARLIDATSMKAYFGRLLAGTGAGLAAAPLAIPLQMQYYESGDWLLNEEDQCTLLSLAGDGINFINPSHTFDAATQDLNLGANRKIRLGLGDPPPGVMSATATDGEILFNFAEPKISVRIPYKVDLSKQPAQPLWLSDPVSLQGEAIFGSSRGNDRIIYRREVMQ
ncbi:TPA: MSHA biogenesis protein MshQ [Aeromonas salmonicida]|nr:MSHA biogenesis protein MshQ [Aeromonas salmonicida]